MKSLLLLIPFILFLNQISHAQDTIFLKKGSYIAAKEIVIGEVEINYKNVLPSNSNAVYSLFKTDVVKIKYQNGKIIDFSNTHQVSSLGGEIPKLQWRFSIGYMVSSVKMPSSSNVDNWWRNINQNQNLIIDKKPINYTYYFAMASALGHTQRNWIGDEVFITLSPVDAMHATNTISSINAINELNLKLFCFDIIMFYGHSINYKKNLIAIFEAGIEGGTMSGIAKLYGTDYKINAMSSIRPHFSLGLDWQLAKHFQANLRIGRRFMNIDEMHTSENSSTGWANFYENLGVSDDLLKVDWSGNYVSFGLAFSFHTKIQGIE